MHKPLTPTIYLVLQPQYFCSPPSIVWPKMVTDHRATTYKQASDTSKLHLLLPFNLSLFAMHFWRKKYNSSSLSLSTRNWWIRVAFSAWTFQLFKVFEVEKNIFCADSIFFINNYFLYLYFDENRWFAIFFHVYIEWKKPKIKVLP